MNTNVITSSLVSLVEEKPELYSRFTKVRPVLKKFCKAKGYKFSELKITNLFGSNNKLTYKINQFVAHIPKPINRSEYRHERYKLEFRSHLTALLKMVTEYDFSESYSESYLLINIPEYLRPILSFLPRIRSTGSLKLNSNENTSQNRFQLSPNAITLLGILVKVSEDLGITSITELLVDNRLHINNSILENVKKAQTNSIYTCLSALRRKLKIKLPPKKKVTFDVSDLPITLKNQLELFEKRAIDGWIENPEMISLAARNGLNITVLRQRTIDLYRNTLLQAMPYVPYEKDLDIRDLLILQEGENIIDGKLTKTLRNLLVDNYRKIESDKITKHKRKGFDSTQFANFLSAIHAIAAFNGIIHLQASFKKQYRAKLDLKTRKLLKINKKMMFPLVSIDKFINNLERKFLTIVKDKSYIFDSNVRKVSETQNNLRFCFFYVSLITMRFTGFRQQYLRNCRFGKNIIFGIDGTIRFQWEAEQTKNNKYFEMIIDPKKHNRSHGVLIKGLLLYKNNIYKYLQKLYKCSINEQFFLRINKKGLPRYFSPVINSDFSTFFINQFVKQAEEEQLYNELGLTIKPHDLRGFAADWYFYSSGRNIEITANLLGDSPQTIIQDYLRGDQHIATSDLDYLNKLNYLDSGIKNETVFSDIGEIERHNKLLEQANRRADIAEKIIDDLRILLSSAHETIINLEQSTQINEQLMRRLENLSFDSKRNDL